MKRRLKMDNTKLQVGQTLYAFGNEDSIEEYVITKIGRTYFHINEVGRKRNFNINTMCYKDANYLRHDKRLYLHKQEIIDIKIEQTIYSKLRRIFNSYSNHEAVMTLDQLKKIADILNLQY